MEKIEPKFDQYLERSYRLSKSYGTVRTHLTALHKFQKFVRIMTVMQNSIYGKDILIVLTVLFVDDLLQSSRS